MKQISRREFGSLVAAGLVAGRLPPDLHAHQKPGAAITAGEIVERIRRNIGVEWKAETVDTIKAGDPSTVVTGVVTTAMATLDVLQRAVRSGANLIITSEPTFYSRADGRTPPVRGGGPGGPGGGAPGAVGGAPSAPPPPPRVDPVYTAKNRFIDENRLVVFRLFDHWRLRRPDPFQQGLAAAMGWEGRQVAGETGRYDIPAASLNTLASELKRRLSLRGGIRVVGNPATRIQRVALLPGTTAISASLAALPGADLVIAGEVREWESIEYARDVVFSGQPKGFITIGRVVSEDPGMGVCAGWLGSIVPEVPARHLAVGDPYWRPVS